MGAENHQYGRLDHRYSMTREYIDRPVVAWGGRGEDHYGRGSVAKINIEDLSAVEDLDKAEQLAAHGGGLKKLKKKAKKSATKAATGAVNSTANAASNSSEVAAVGDVGEHGRSRGDRAYNNPGEYTNAAGDAVVDYWEWSR